MTYGQVLFELGIKKESLQKAQDMLHENEELLSALENPTITKKEKVGYLFHLYIDRRFFKYYMPRIVEFRNAQDERQERRDMVKDVLLKRTGQRLSKQDFFSEKYYYGDYTKMNMYLVNRYQIPTTLDPNISNPGIKEVDYEDVKQVLKELKTYMKVPKDAVKNVRVFDVEDLLFFLENAVGVFKI